MWGKYDTWTKLREKRRKLKEWRINIVPYGTHFFQNNKIVGCCCSCFFYSATIHNKSRMQMRLQRECRKRGNDIKKRSTEFHFNSVISFEMTFSSMLFIHDSYLHRVLCGFLLSFWFFIFVWALILIQFLLLSAARCSVAYFLSNVTFYQFSCRINHFEAMQRKPDDMSTTKKSADVFFEHISDAKAQQQSVLNICQAKTFDQLRSSCYLMTAQNFLWAIKCALTSFFVCTVSLFNYPFICSFINLCRFVAEKRILKSAKSKLLNIKWDLWYASLYTHNTFDSTEKSSLFPLTFSFFNYNVYIIVRWMSWLCRRFVPFYCTIIII